MVISQGEPPSEMSKYSVFPLRQTVVVNSNRCPSFCRQTSCPNGFCSTCFPGYFASNGRCYACSKNCNTCQNGASFCTSCNGGSYFIESRCESCSSGCSNCSNGSQCQTCRSGYFKSTIRPGYCDACSNNCSTCSSFDVCTGCGLMWKLEGTKCIEKTVIEKIITYLWIMLILCCLCCCTIPLLISCYVKNKIEALLRGASKKKGSYDLSNSDIF